MEKLTNVKALAIAIEEGNLSAEVVEKLTAIKASFEKKSANKKPTANQKENENFKTLIAEVLNAAGKPMTVTEIQDANAELKALSNQRVSAILRQMKEEGTVDKNTDKKKSYFFTI